VLTWAAIPFLFFSFAGTKLPNYVALLLPALAILVALWFADVFAGAMRRAALISAATIPAFIACVAFALAVFSRTNSLESVMAALGGQLAFLGATMLIGSLITVAVMARRDTIGWSPYVLALTSGALVLFIAFIGEPAAEAFKPIPPLARTIQALRMPGDIVGIHSVSGGNALLFYTTPPVRVINRDVDFYATICPAGRAWIVAAPAEAARFTQLARDVGRSADVVADAPSGPQPRAALLHVFGAPCNKAVATRLISQLRRRRLQ